jgi:hypothetical protein
MSKTAAEIGLIIGGIALAAVGGAGAAGLISLGANAAMYNGMVGIGLSTALSGVGIALRPSTNPTGAPNTISFSNGPSPRRVIYGQFQTAGVLTYASFPNSQNLSNDSQYLHLVYTLVGHEISSFDGIAVNGTPYNFGTDLIYGGGVGDNLWHLYPGSNPAYNDFYWEHMFFEFDFGRAANVGQPFPALASVDSGWTSACLQRGCAKVHVILRADQSWPALYPSGELPNIQFLVTGKKLVDPRVVTGWLASSGYVQYDYVLDDNDVIWVQQNTSGTSGATRPNFEANDTPGTTISDGGCSWKSSGLNMATVTAPTSSAPQGNLYQGRLVNDVWAPATGYTGIIEAPIGYLQQVTGGSGVSGASEPNWATTVGGTTTDSGLTWTCLGRSTHAINPSNSALVVNDYLQDSDYGLNAALDTIDLSSVIAAANVCEEQELIIWNSDNTVLYENQYSANGMFDFSSTRGDVLSSLSGSMAGWVIPPGDLWHVFAGSYQTPSVSLGDTDMRGPIKGDFRLSARDVLNTVGATYVPAFLATNLAAQATMTQLPGTWQAQNAPEYQANGLAGKPDYLYSEDGGQVLRLKLQLDFTTSLWTAQRLEKIAMMRTRFQQTLSLPCKITALQLEAGDTFSFTHTRWGIIGQVFEATQISVSFDSGGASQDDTPVVGVDIVARQTDPSIYEFTGPSSASDFGEYSPFGVTGVMTGVE